MTESGRPGVPPPIARWLLALASPEHVRNAVVGDADELFARVAEDRGARAARWWYRRQAVRSAPPLLAARLRRVAADCRKAYSPERGDGTVTRLYLDLRYALKSLRSSPGLALGVVVSLTLGIGATTVTYGVVDGLILNPYDYPEGDRLVAVGTQYPKLGATDLGFIEHISPPEFVDIRDAVAGLERVVAWDIGNRGVAFGDVAENLLTGFWWGDGLRTLGVDPVEGRGMTLEETLEGAPVALLSHRVWQNRFGGDPELVGGTILMDGDPRTVIGILPPGDVLFGMDLWIPMGVDPTVIPRTARQWQVLGRVAEGTTLESVNAELSALARRTESEFGGEFEEYEAWRMEAVPLSRSVTGQFMAAGGMLLGAVGFVLLLLCSNIASLLLARATGRRREIAVRTALGAGRGRILSQLVAESLTLALVGGGLGVAVAYLGLDAIQGIVATIPFAAGGVEMNTRVLAFTAGVSVLCGLLFGLAPALRAAGYDIQDALRREGGAATMTRQKIGLQKTLVGLQVALAVVLLSGGGLFVHSLLNLGAVDPGFDPENVLTLRMTLPREEYDPAAVEAFFSEMERRTAEIPGVVAAGYASQFPPVGFSRSTFQSEELQLTSEGEMPVLLLTRASPSYFDVLGLEARRGRLLDASDVSGGPTVAVLNQAAADLLFPAGEAVGGRIRPNPETPWAEVVGVVPNTANIGIDQPPAPEVYVSVHQLLGGWNQLFLLARTRTDPMTLLPAVRQEVSALDPDQPVYAIRTMEQAIAQGVGPFRVAAMTLGAFAGFALLLAALGIYGIVTFTVGQRTREIGLRMALGAGAGRVRWMIVTQALLPVGIGAVVGLAGTAALGGLLEQLLFELTATDPATLATVTLIFLAVAASAAAVPAVRASRMDPATTLRED